MDLFQIAIDQPVKAEFLDWLSPEETHRANAFRFDHLKNRYIVAHAVLRKILSGYLKCSPADIGYIQNEWGKPVISGGPHFSLSHSDDSAILAVDNDREVGIDLETGSLVLTPGEMERVMSPAEIDQGNQRQLSGGDLLRLWVRKESVLKSLGKGISHDPRRVFVGLAPADFDNWQMVSTVDEGIEKTFYVLDISLGRMFCAIARRDAPLPRASISIRKLSTDSVS